MLPVRNLFDAWLCWKSADVIFFFFTYQHISLINPQTDCQSQIFLSKQKEFSVQTISRCLDALHPGTR